MAGSEEDALLAVKIVSGLERIGIGLGSALWEAGSAYKLTPLQIRILLHLEGRAADVTVGSLSDEFGVSAPTVSDALRTLTERKWTIKRKQGRRVLASLAPEGRRIVRKVHEYNRPFLEQVRRLPGRRAEELLLSLLEILAGLQEQGTLRADRSCLTCRHLRGRRPGRGYHCALMGVPLPVADLRVDCPEHARA